MKKLQTLKAKDGFEVALFPLEYMYISQGELMPNNSWTHYNVYNIDFLGWDSDGRKTKCEVYAPFTMKVVALWDFTGSHTVTFESVNKVHFADGSLDYMTIEFTHANEPPIFVLNATVQQGRLCYYTGTYGQATGDHVHMCVGKGKYNGYTLRDGGHYDLTNRYHMYDALCINDTNILNDDGYDWKLWNQPIPVERRKNHFKWVLYAEKLRNKNV